MSVRNVSLKSSTCQSLANLWQEPEQHTVSLSSYGELISLESTNLAAQVAGEVTSWNKSFVAGGIVKRGDVLFSIEKDAYEAALLQAEAAVYNARSLLIQEQAQADVAKREAENMPDSRVTDLYLRKPQVLSAQAALKSAEAQLRIAKRDLENCEVKAAELKDGLLRVSLERIIPEAQKSRVIDIK